MSIKIWDKRWSKMASQKRQKRLSDAQKSNYFRGKEAKKGEVVEKSRHSHTRNALSVPKFEAPGKQKAKSENFSLFLLHLKKLRNKTHLNTI